MPSIPASSLNKRLKFKLFAKNERNYWKNLEVNVDAFCDKWSFFRGKLEHLLDELDMNNLQTICKIYTLSNNTKSSYKATILNDLKTSVDVYCCLYFAQENPKTTSRHFGIPIRSGNINRKKVFIETILAHKKGELPVIFLLQYAHKKGSAKIPFDVVANKNKTTFEDTKVYIQQLVRHLNRFDKLGNEHLLRFSETVKGDHYFLLLKETQDKIFPALPDNCRVQLGKYILIRFVATTGKLMIDTQDPKEAFHIKNYIAWRSKTTIRYVTTTDKYNPAKFFNSISAEKAINNDITLIDVEFRETRIGKQALRIKEENKKNDIVHVINWLKANGIIKLEDFSEFKSMVFSSEGIRYTIIIHKNSWGRLKLQLIDKNRPAAELETFKKAFQSAFKIPFDTILRNENEDIDTVAIIRNILDNKTIPAEIPEDVEDILLGLMKRKFIKKPTHNAKRRCEKCRHIYWEKGDCRLCGNKSYIDGDYLDVEIDEGYFYAYFIKALHKTKGLKASRVTRQITGKKYSLIEVIDKTGNFLSIYLSRSNPPQPVLDHFIENGNPLLIVLLKYSNAIREDILSKNFEAIDFAQIANNDIKFVGYKVKEAITSQLNKWRVKVITKGWASYNRLEKKKLDYGDQDFENDIYNILHEIFLIADRMGGRFTGIKAPDGVLAIQDYAVPRHRFCMAWDCKYSILSKGYQLTENPKKHKHYLNKLSKLDKVRFFGHLKTYAIISQNMDKSKYEKFYKKVLFGSRWKGNFLLVEEKNLLLLYKIYKDNEGLIGSYPSIFYRRAFNLFKAPLRAESEPFKFISNERILNMFEYLKKDYDKVHKRFKFKRTDFE